MRHFPPSEPSGSLRSGFAADNIFTIVDGEPYLVGTYGDLVNIMSIEKETIQNQLTVETTDPRLSIIDIVFDRIGTDPIGNDTQYLRVLDAILRNRIRLNGSMDVIRPGLEVNLEYELTSEKNGTLVRKATIGMFITNRCQYLDHNDLNPVTSQILTNFIDSTVKTITDRAYGSDRLVLTLTNLTVGYQVVTGTAYHPPVGPRGERGPIGYIAEDEAHLNLRDLYEGIYERDRYVTNNTRVLPGIDYGCIGDLYHFENGGRRMCLHRDEIDKQNATVKHVIIFTTKIDKSFIVVGGHRLEFRFSGWISNETVVGDTSKVYRLLTEGQCHHHHHCDHDHDHTPHDHGNHCGDSDITRLLTAIATESHRNDLQECDLRSLNGQVDLLSELIAGLGDKMDIQVALLKEAITAIETGSGDKPVVPDPEPTPDPAPEPDPVLPDPEIPPIVE